MISTIQAGPRRLGLGMPVLVMTFGWRSDGREHMHLATRAERMSWYLILERACSTHAVGKREGQTPTEDVFTCTWPSPSLTPSPRSSETGNGERLPLALGRAPSCAVPACGLDQVGLAARCCIAALPLPDTTPREIAIIIQTPIVRTLSPSRAAQSRRRPPCRGSRSSSVLTSRVCTTSPAKPSRRTRASQSQPGVWRRR